MTTAQIDRTHRPLLGIGLRIGSMAMFAVMAVIIKLLSTSGLPEAELIFFRSLFGMVPALIWIAIYRRPDIIKTTKPRAHIIRAVVGLAAMFCTFAGLARLPLNDATAIGFTGPIFATLISAVVLSEKIGIHRGLAIAAGFVGVLILTNVGSSSTISFGSYIMLLAALLTAVVSVTLRQISQTEHSVTITFYFMLAGVMITGLFMPFIWVTPDPKSWVLLVGLGLSGGMLQLLLSASLRYASVPTVMPFDYTQIIFVGLLSWIMWSELPDSRTIIGGGIIIASGLYILYRETIRRIPKNRGTTPVEEG